MSVHEGKYHAFNTDYINEKGSGSEYILLYSDPLPLYTILLNHCQLKVSSLITIDTDNSLVIIL